MKSDPFSSLSCTWHIIALSSVNAWTYKTHILIQKRYILSMHNRKKSLHHSLSTREQCLNLRYATGANASSEWTIVSISFLMQNRWVVLNIHSWEKTYTTMRFLKSGQSRVKVSYSPPSPQIWHWYFSFCHITMSVYMNNRYEEGITNSHSSGYISPIVFPKWDAFKPMAATLTRMACTPESAISFNNSFWSRSQR